MSIEVTATPPVDWDAYVAKHASATAYHRAAAVTIGASAFGLRTAFLTARSGSRDVVGVLPLVEQSSLVFGRFLVSVPFFTYGGVLADDAATAAALGEHAAALAKERRADHVELRHSMPVDGLGEFPVRLDKVSMVLPLPESDDALGKRLGSKLRSQIKRGDREDPELVWGGADLLDDFYEVFASSMHSLGTPVYSRRFFDVVCAALHDSVAVLVVRLDGTPQAAALVVRHGRTVEVPWAAATPRGKKAAINMKMYWAMLQHSIVAGAEAFDFGRSTVGSGTYAFKQQWGAEPRQLHWHYWLRSGTKVPMLNHVNPKYALAGAVWRRMPLWCANLLGPQIAKNLP